MVDNGKSQFGQCIGQPTREVKWGPGRQILLEYYNDFKCRHGEDLDLFKGPIYWHYIDMERKTENRNHVRY